MKRIASRLLAVLLIMMTASACGTQTGQHNAGAADKISIVATTFPQYDWARQILGDQADNIKLTLLLDDGVDLHSYQPTVGDIATISACDMFIYVGGESDGWVSDALATAKNKNMSVVNLLEVLGDKVKEEEIIEGMEHDHAHGHGEIDAADIHDRPLSDWKGSWMTIEKALESGDLDEYVEHNAAENGNDFDTQRDTYARRWKSNYANLTITDEGIAFDGIASSYQYIGYRLVESEHGTSVWYGFAADEAAAAAPKFIAFSDHGTGEEEGGHDEQDEHGSPHFHFRYGDESVEALVGVEDWSPTFFAASASGEEIAKAMGGHSHSHEYEFDEHVWLSLKNAQILVTYISGELQKIDEKNASVYAANTEAYHAKLSQLDAAYQSTVSEAAVKTLLFGDRFPFRYLADDYGLSYYAAFPGCSAETEASFETIVFLSGKIDQLELSHVMVIENADQSIAKTIVNNTNMKNQTILALDSMQSVTARDISSGTTYLSIMESNLNVLEAALS